MAHDIPTTEPTVLTVGDTATWTRSEPDYLPADSWVLKYVLINASASIDITASDNGDGTHLVSEAAATTASYTAGDYRWQAYVTKGAERYTVGRGELTIKANFDAETTYDGRTTWVKILDDLETAYAAMAAGDIEVYEADHNGRSVKYRTLEDLIKAISHAKTLADQELAADAIRQREPR